MSAKRIVIIGVCVVLLCVIAFCVWRLGASYMPVPVNDTPPDIFTPPIVL